MKEFESIGEEELARLTEKFFGFKVPPKQEEALIKIPQKPKIEARSPKIVEVDGKRFKVRDAGEVLRAADIPHKIPNGQKPGSRKHPQGS